MQEILTQVTADLARHAFDLHRLAKTAEDVSTLKSPTTRREHGDVSRPTEETALCPRRTDVRDAARDSIGTLRTVEQRLTRVLDAWGGHSSTP